MGERPSTRRWRTVKSAIRASTSPRGGLGSKARSFREELGVAGSGDHDVGRDREVGEVPEDPASAHSAVDQAIRRSLQAVAAQWAPGPATHPGDPGSSKRRLLAEARRRARRRATVAGVAVAAVLLGGGVAGVLSGAGAGGPLVAGAVHGTRRSPERSPEAARSSRAASDCALVQVGPGTARCGGLVVKAASSGEQRPASGGAASPLAPAFSGAATGASAAAGSVSPRPTSAGATRSAVSLPPAPSASSASSSLSVVVHVGRVLRVVLPALSGVVWTYPVVVPGSSGSASALSGSPPVLVRVWGSGRALDERVAARFLARRPGSVVLVASAGPVCSATHAPCAAARWRWQVTVRVVPPAGAS